MQWVDRYNNLRTQRVNEEGDARGQADAARNEGGTVNRHDPQPRTRCAAEWSAFGPGPLWQAHSVRPGFKMRTWEWAAAMLAVPLFLKPATSASRLAAGPP
jgi:hypothetical protein